MKGIGLAIRNDSLKQLLEKTESGGSSANIKYWLIKIKYILFQIR